MAVAQITAPCKTCLDAWKPVSASCPTRDSQWMPFDTSISARGAGHLFRPPPARKVDEIVIISAPKHFPEWRKGHGETRIARSIGGEAGKRIRS